MGDNNIIVLIVTACIIGWLVNNWIRAKHGYPLENEWGGFSERTDDASNNELKRENTALRQELKTVHDRVAVLERIVTDKGYGLADEIEALRSSADSGVPLDMAKRERV